MRLCWYLDFIMNSLDRTFDIKIYRVLRYIIDPSTVETKSCTIYCRPGIFRKRVFGIFEKNLKITFFPKCFWKMFKSLLSLHNSARSTQKCQWNHKIVYNQATVNSLSIVDANCCWTSRQIDTIKHGFKDSDRSGKLTSSELMLKTFNMLVAQLTT